MWDWRTGYNFQRIHAAVQPGSLDSESGIFACVFDNSESRLITAEADKTIKVYKEDDTAVCCTIALHLCFCANSHRAKRKTINDHHVLFLADGRKSPSQLETRNPQEEKILVFLLVLVVTLTVICFISTSFCCSYSQLTLLRQADFASNNATLTEASRFIL